MKKRGIIIAGAVLILAILIAVIWKNSAGSKDVVAEESPLVEVENAYEEVAQIYTKPYQDGIKSQIEALEKDGHSLREPLIIANPYSTNTTGLYVSFETEEEASISYTVAVEGLEDFSRTLYNGEVDNLTTEHRYMMIGCVPEKENTICITASDAAGKKLGSYTFTYQAPPLLNQQNKPQAEVIKGESQEPLANGLYTVLGNDLSEDEMDEDYVAMYDNMGVIRCEIPIINFRAHDFIFDEKGMYYSISSSSIACLDRTGYVRYVYGMKDFRLHHEYVFGTKNDILVLASEANTETKDDRIISVDISTGEVTEVVDLRKIFPDYMPMATLAEGAEVLDWMHINSMQLMGEDGLIISSRETSTIIYLDNIYGTPTVRYMIGSANFWAGSGYEDLLLKQDGEFSLQGGQHSVVYQPDDSLPEGQYYLILYNNNNTYSFTRKEYDWSADDNYYDTGVAMESNGNPSYYYKYLIDENAGIFSLADSIPVGYSGFVSSVQNVDGNIVIDSGGIFTTYEFDSEGKLIQQLTYGGSKWIYRTKKYEYLNYWFI